MRYGLCVVTFILLLLAVQPLMAQRDLAIVGSSTSACYGATSVDSCYVGRLRFYYNQMTPNDTTIDNGYAVGGYNCYQGMPTGYVPPYSDAGYQPDAAHNITAALASQPNVVLVNYPTNNYDVLPVDSILFCLRTIRNTAVQAGVPCFVTTTQPRTSGDFNTSAIKAKLALLKDSILAEFGYFSVDFYTDLINPDSSIRYDFGDGTHMNNTGHDSLFVRVLAKSVFLATLPATFLKFNTIYKNNTDIISWTTAKETNVSYYEVQRSNDGTDFLNLSSVQANNSNGNNQYQYTDAQPVKGYNYYKIIIVDKDGNKHASPVMTVYINNGKLRLIRAFARSSSQVALELQNNDAQNADIEIINNIGMVVSKTSAKVEAGNTTLFINTALQSNGVYYIKLTTSKETVVGSFIKN
jgi:hypothetical protein